MKYKLLVLDVDGTLLNDAKEISKRTLAALLKVQQMGVRIVLASGRPTYGLMPLAKSLELGNYGGFILSYNGCQIINAQNGEILFERRINPEMLPYLEKKARKNNFALFTYHDDTIITDTPENEHIRNEARLNNLKVIKEEEFSAAIDFAPCKCMLVSDDEESLVSLEGHWKRRLNGALDVFRSEPYFLEVVPCAIDKANTLGALLEQLEHCHTPVVVDATGRVLDTAVVYPTQPFNKIAETKRRVTDLLKKHHVTVISIGNGTASRESEKIVAELIAESGLPVQYAIVSEAGASVYSASKLASEEFPEYDVNLRSAVSIARRLQDPLAELVKIDPKAIGIGQYQHDMPPARLDAALAGVVESCVNSVGVDLNTASPSLLGHIAGINAAIAKNIVAYREENGGFTARPQLLKVPKLGKKAYEQCAGFLRISGGKNPLDATAVHPESYPIAEGLLTLCGCTLADIGTEKLRELPAMAEKMGYKVLAQQLSAGEPTVRDIIAELQKPGRDPRESLPPTVLRSDVLEMKDLKPEMELTGTVRNVVDFGAFVDIGVHEDGLVHISQIGEKYVKHPGDVLKVGDIVRVKVLEVDQKRGRISLTMRGVKQPARL